MLKYKNIVVLDINVWDDEKINLFSSEFLKNPPMLNFDMMNILNGKSISPVDVDNYKIEDVKNILLVSFENLEDATLFKLRWS